MTGSELLTKDQCNVALLTFQWIYIYIYIYNLIESMLLHLGRGLIQNMYDSPGNELHHDVATQ